MGSCMGAVGAAKQKEEMKKEEIRKIILVHGWDGSPERGWWPWMRAECKKLGLQVHAPQLPGGENPQLPKWVDTIASLVGDDTASTILVGHSLGCDAILRYVERLSPAQRIVAIVLVAPFFDETDIEDLKEFNGQAVNIGRVKIVAQQKVAFFSSDDPHIPLKEGIEYQHRLGAQIHILKNRGHFTPDDKCVSIPEVLEAVKKIIT